MSLFDLLPMEIVQKIEGHVTDLYHQEHVQRYSLVMDELLHVTPAVRYRLDEEYPHFHPDVIEWVPRIHNDYRGNPVRREKGKWHLSDMHWITRHTAEAINGSKMLEAGYHMQFRYFYDIAQKKAERVYAFVKY